MSEVRTSHIHVITPITTPGLRKSEDFDDFRDACVKITNEILDEGPASIESEFDEALAIPDVIRKSIAAEKNGADAIVIDCLGGPGVRPAREVVSIPVVGPGESSMHMAAMLGLNFTVVTVLESVCPMIEDTAKIYGVSDKLKSIRVVEIPVLKLEADTEHLYSALAAEAVAAVRQDNSHGIVLGCTGMSGCAEFVETALRNEFGVYIPVVDPVPVAIATAITLVKLGLSNSKKTYAKPHKKDIVGFDIQF